MTEPLTNVALFQQLYIHALASQVIISNLRYTDEHNANEAYDAAVAAYARFQEGMEESKGKQGFN